MIEVLKRGWHKGVNITWELVIKIVLPVYLMVSILQYTPVIDWLSAILSPFMSWFGLPGEAALPLVLSVLSNCYAGLAAALSLGLNHNELFILAAMTIMAHELPVETAVCKKSGSNTAVIVLVRLGMAMLFGLMVNLVLPGGVS